MLGLFFSGPFSFLMEMEKDLEWLVNFTSESLGHGPRAEVSVTGVTQ